MKYVIEHMEEGFSEWVTLEYIQILKEVGRDNLLLTSLPKGTTDECIPKSLRDLGVQWTVKECSEIQDKEKFDKTKFCLLDPSAEADLSPADAQKFEFFVFGGILGSHPRVDRTGILRSKYGFAGRRLGELQMTTDTAVRVTQKIAQENKELKDLKFIDYPEIRFNKNEATEMPFRYLVDKDGLPILPENMLSLIKADSERSIEDILMDEFN